MPRPLLVVPLVLALAVGFWLTRAALVRWRDLKSAQTYELVAEQRPLLLRAGGAVLCGMCVTALTVAVALDGRGVHPARAAVVVAAAGGLGLARTAAGGHPVRRDRQARRG
ncbi:hypothetical protein [Kitasatospora sp. Root107]|uniref:hypothetical protein n=1 Tax=Kitasatospora sp. Root107 TaxID=1736424 RepID=UPI000709B324|nr:hypothetical protein [Kitasatospora sp. Root107]KQV18821.1 hypothetical protein ASC99_06430 [Kitasatospora sp. Root107]